MIRTVKLTDADAICKIYNPYVTETIITFEESLVSPEAMVDRIKYITGTLPWLVDCENGVVKGYAYAGKWRSRSAYRYSVEATVYVEQSSQGQGGGLCFTPSCLLGFDDWVCTRQWAASLCQTRPVWLCMRNSVFEKSPTLVKWV